MKKSDEIDDPKSCWNKAGMNTVVFVLLAQDPSFADTVEYWANNRIARGKNVESDPKIVEARKTAKMIREQFGTEPISSTAEEVEKSLPSPEMSDEQREKLKKVWDKIHKGFRG